MSKLKLKIIHYHFDTDKPKERAAWFALCKKLDDGRHQHSSHSGGNQPFTKNYEEEIEVDPKVIFSDQFNEKGGENRRLFDWYLQYRLLAKRIKQGHYVEDLTELNEIRQNTFTCGYCGKPGSEEFCDKCIGSEFLEKDQLHLLRLKSKSLFMPKRETLTKEEESVLVPLWEKAQGLGKLSREERLLSKQRQKIDKYISDAEMDAWELVEKAKFKYDTHTWLLNNKFKDLGNTIVYEKENFRLTFGWRTKIEDEDALKTLLKDAPFEWRIKQPS